MFGRPTQTNDMNHLTDSCNRQRGQILFLFLLLGLAVPFCLTVSYMLSELPVDVSLCTAERVL